MRVILKFFSNFYEFRFVVITREVGCFFVFCAV